MNIKSIEHYTGHKGALYALERNRSEGEWLTCGSDKLLTLWSVISGNDGKAVAMFPSVVYSICYMDTHSELWIGTAAGQIHILDIVSFREKRILQIGQSAIYSISHYPLLSVICATSANGELIVLNDESYTVIKIIKTCDAKVRCTAFISANQTIAVGNGDGSITFVDSTSLTTVDRVQAHALGFSVNCLLYLQQQGLLCSGARDAHIHIMQVADGATIHSIPAHNYAIYAMKANDAGNLIATCSRDKSIKIWNNKFQFLYKIAAPTQISHKHSVNNLLWLDNKQLISCSDDKSCIRWSIEN